MPPVDPAPRLPVLVAEACALGPRLPDVAAVWGARRLDPKLREQVMLAVAQANDCRLCSLAHRRWALAEGVSDAEIAALEQEDPRRFDRRTWAAIAWAQATVHAGPDPAPEEFTTELARHFDAGRRADLELVVRVMTLANRSASTAEALRARIAGAPVPGSRLVDELAVGTLVALAVPPVAAYLAVASRRAARRAEPAAA